MPPAIAAVPWTYVLGGDTLFSLVSLLVMYLAALIVTPATMITFLGVGSLLQYHLQEFVEQPVYLSGLNPLP